jgi:hypothetical protein
MPNQKTCVYTVGDLRENKTPAMRYGYRLTHPTAGMLFVCQTLAPLGGLGETPRAVSSIATNFLDPQENCPAFGSATNPLTAH